MHHPKLISDIYYLKSRAIDWCFAVRIIIVVKAIEIEVSMSVTTNDNIRKSCVDILWNWFIGWIVTGQSYLVTTCKVRLLHDKMGGNDLQSTIVT